MLPEPYKSPALHPITPDPALLLPQHILADHAIGVVICDALLPDMPIVYINRGFSAITGYKETEVLGKNCRFLQSHDHPQPQINNIRAAIANRHPHHTVVRNYRKDGSLFWNDLMVYPILNADGRTTHFIGIQRDITSEYTAASAAVPPETTDLPHVVATHLPAMIVYWDRAGCCRFANPSIQQLYGFSHDEMTGKNLEEVLEASTYALHKPHIDSTLRGNTSTFDYTVRNPDGTIRHIQSTFTPHMVAGEISGFIALSQDITGQKISEEALHEERERSAVAFKSVGDGIIITDAQGIITYINPIAETVTGWQRDEAIGCAIEQVIQLIDSTTRESATNPVSVALREQRAVGLAMNTSIVRRNGYETPVEESATPVRDRNGRINGAVMVFHDISEIRAMSFKMSHLAHYDTLTDLPNRALLEDRLEQAIALAERNEKRCAIMFLDIDRFKHINDSLGHHIGDRLLQEVAQRLQATVRRTDTVSRSGGDEFVILLTEIGATRDVDAIAGKILESTATPCSIDGNELHVSFSIGISIFPDDGTDAEALTKHADTAMYYAKQSGRNNYQFFTPRLDQHAMQRLVMESSLREALKSDRFILNFQPQISLHNYEIIGAEALIRWHHPNGSVIHPNDFIPLAEESGLIVQIGTWVLAEACRQSKAWQNIGLPAVPIAVNLSALQLRDKALVHTIDAILRETRLAPELLELEITESVVMSDVEQTNQVLQQIKALGVRVAIDDFGTGYSSLSYLKRFPIDAIKIDRSFVRDIVTDQDAAAITSAIISMARSLRQRVIAEGVETIEQAMVLQAQKCDEMQGYYFSKPISAEHFALLLQAPASAEYKP